MNFFKKLQRLSHHELRTLAELSAGAAFLALLTLVLSGSIASFPALDLALGQHAQAAAVTTVPDSSGNSHTGTLVGNTGFMIGAIGDALSLDGSGDYMTVGSVTSGTTLTYAFWIKVASLPASNKTILWDDGSASGGDSWIQLTPAGRIETQRSSDGFGALTSATSISAGAWTHVAIVADASGKKIYINGVLNTSNATPIASRSGKSYLTIGASYDGNSLQSGGQYWNGGIDEMRVYNRALSASEVSDLYTNSSPSSSGLVGYWPFDASSVYCLGQNGAGGAASCPKTSQSIDYASTTVVSWYMDNVTPSSCTVTGPSGLLYNPAGIDSDTSGNDNDITLVGLSSADQVVDSPTDSYATWSPLDKVVDGGSYGVKSGNLHTWTGDNGGVAYFSSYKFSSGKYYAEITPQAMSGFSNFYAGVSCDNGEKRHYKSNGQFYNGSSWVSGGSSWGAGDTVGIAVDDTAGSASFYKNGALQGSLSFTPGLCAFAAHMDEQVYDGWDANFGQGGVSGLTCYLDAGSAGGCFKYAPPAGYKALSTANMPAPAIARPSSYFDAITYTGDGASSRSVSGFNFQPDLAIIKNRTSGNYWHWYDSVRGAAWDLISSITQGQIQNYGVGYLNAFLSNGFSLAAGNTGVADVNKNGDSYVSWGWKEGTLPGFDIVSYAGDGTTNRSIAQNTGGTPGLVWAKRTDSASDWYTWSSGASYYGSPSASMKLNSNAGLGGAGWGTAAQTPSTFMVSNDGADSTNAGDSAVRLLLHFNGAANSTPVADSSAGAHALLSGGPALTGSGTAGFPAVGNLSVVYPGSDDLYLPGDFTIDLWVDPLDPSATATLYTKSGYLVWMSGGNFYFLGSSNNTSWDIGMMWIGTAQGNTWQHLAITRSGNTFRTFKNGVLATTLTSSLVPAHNSDSAAMGDGFWGYMDEVQVIKGRAQWTTNFTPPNPATGDAGQYIAYVFKPVDGFSQFGGFLGNTNFDGPYIYTGFRPRLVMLKNVVGGTSWVWEDSARCSSTYCPGGAQTTQNLLFPNTAGTEENTDAIDFLSTGFKLRTNGSWTNGSEIYAVFAQAPLQQSAQPYNLSLQSSMRFNGQGGAPVFGGGVSGYISRTNTLASTGGGKKFTFSAWVKRGAFAANQALLSAGSPGGPLSTILFGQINGANGSDSLGFAQRNGSGSTVFQNLTTAVFRDPAAWYHIVVAVDTTQASAANRVRMYVNGVEETSYYINSPPALNATQDIATNNGTTNIGRSVDGSSYFDGYLSDVYLIDGQQLAPSSFGEYDPNGYWRPKNYSCTDTVSQCYGNNGFHLRFLGGDNGRNITGSTVTPPVTSTQTYTLSCLDTLGVAVSTTTTITVNPPRLTLASCNASDASCTSSSVTAAIVNRVYLTSGSAWTVPADWNNGNNTVEVIGGGAGGGGASTGSNVQGMGGGGGGYSKISNLNLTPGASVAYRVGAGGSGGAVGSVGTAGGDTYFCNSTSNCSSISGSAVQVGAKGGGVGSSGATPRSGGAGGSSASGVGTTKYSGGAGGVENTIAGSGGGGAAGPNGNGAAGGANAASLGSGGSGGGGSGGGTTGAANTIGGVGGVGGKNSLNAGGGAGGTAGTTGASGNAGGGGGGGAGNNSGFQTGSAGGAGGAGTEWDAAYGSGGGGGGGGGASGSSAAYGGGAGGLYGGGGGGAGSNQNNTGGVGGAGAQGLIVITYTTSAVPTNPNGYSLVKANQPAHISWRAQSVQASSCSVSPDTTPVSAGVASTTGVYAYALGSASTTLTLACTTPAPLSVTTRIAAIPATCENRYVASPDASTNPWSCTFGANSTSVFSGNTPLISWSCPANLGDTGSSGSGSGFSTGGAAFGTYRPSTPPAEGTVYSLTCNPTGSTGTTTIHVSNPVIGVVAGGSSGISGNRVRSGTRPSFVLTLQNVTPGACTLGRAGQAPFAAGLQDAQNGTVVQDPSPIYAPTKYALTCSDGTGQDISVSTTVNLIPSAREI